MLTLFSNSIHRLLLDLPYNEIPTSAKSHHVQGEYLKPVDRYRFYNLLLKTPIKQINPKPLDPSSKVEVVEPSMPTNCCMSGCAICVWDIYQEELEAHARESGQGSGNG